MRAYPHASAARQKRSTAATSVDHVCTPSAITVQHDGPPRRRCQSRLRPRDKVALMHARVLALAVVTLLLAAPVAAQTPVESARALVARYHESPANIDKARDLLEAALAKDIGRAHV